MNQSVSQRYDDTQMGAAQLVAAALGRSLGVKVVVANVSTAMTDGETIWLPPLPVQASQQLSALLWGFIHHEAGHCRHTDFSLGEHIASENDALLNSLRNVLEDIRMESAHMRLYPGAHRVLCDMLESLKDIGFYQPSTPEDPPSSLVCNFLNKYCRTYILQQPPLKDQAELARKHLEEKLGTGFVTRLVALAQQVTSCDSSEDSLNLAYRIREFIEEEQSQEQQQQQQQQQQSDQQGPADSSPDSSDNGDDPDEVESSATGDSNEEETESGLDDSNDDSTAPAPAAKNGDEEPGDEEPCGSQPGNSQTTPDDQDRSDFLDSVLSGAGLDSETDDLGDALSQVLADELDQTDDDQLVLPTTVTISHSGRDESAVATAQQVSSRLASQLKRQLESHKRIASLPRANGQRVSRRHLHRVALKDYRVFTRRTTQTTVNTSIVCLLDTSTSMGWHQAYRLKIEVAREALLATGIALSSVRDLSVCTAAFPAHGNDSEVLILSDFTEFPANVSSRFSLRASGGTPMAEAILWAGNKLNLQPSDQRKIILVATDGDPNRPLPTAQVVRMVESSGIEVYGLGIQSEDNHNVFRHFVTVDDISHLCQAYLDLFQTVLRRSA